MLRRKSLAIIAVLLLLGLFFYQSLYSKIDATLVFSSSTAPTSDSELHEYVSIRINNQSNQKYSKFRCTGDMNNIESWKERLCLFNHVCYARHKKQFQYYRRDATKPLFFDGVKKILYDFSTRNKSGQGFVAIGLAHDSTFSWAPYVVDHPYPTKNLTQLTNLHR